MFHFRAPYEDHPNTVTATQILIKRSAEREISIIDSKQAFDAVWSAYANGNFNSGSNSYHQSGH